MADYTPTTDFSAKDSLSPGDPEKIILGADFDVEFDNISTAVTTKFDSADYATLGQAQAGTNAVVLMTPERVQDWGDANGGIVGDLRALADPNADTILGWDDSAGAAINYTIGAGITSDTTTIRADLLGLQDLTDPNDDRIYFWDDSAGLSTWLDIGTGVQISGTTLSTNDGAIVHDSLSGFVANEHIDHSAVSITAGDGLTGGGTIAATRTIDLDISGLTGFSGSLATSDGFLVDDGGTMKRFSYNDSGLIISTVTGTSDTLATADMNTYLRYTNGSAVTVTLNTGVGEAGNTVIIEQAGAGQVTVSGTATRNAAIGNKTRTQNSVIVLVCTAANTWTIYGDASA